MSSQYTPQRTLDTDRSDQHRATRCESLLTCECLADGFDTAGHIGSAFARQGPYVGRHLGCDGRVWGPSGNFSTRSCRLPHRVSRPSGPSGDALFLLLECKHVTQPNHMTRWENCKNGLECEFEVAQQSSFDSPFSSSSHTASRSVFSTQHQHRQHQQLVLHHRCQSTSKELTPCLSNRSGNVADLQGARPRGPRRCHGQHLVPGIHCQGPPWNHHQG